MVYVLSRVPNIYFQIHIMYGVHWYKDKSQMLVVDLSIGVIYGILGIKTSIDPYVFICIVLCNNRYLTWIEQ